MAHPNVVHVNASDFTAEVLESTTPVLVDFWAPRCGACIQLSPVIDEIASERVGKAKVVKVNVDENLPLADQFRVNSIPALILFKGGQIAERLVGRQPKAQILSKLDSIA